MNYPTSAFPSYALTATFYLTQVYIESEKITYLIRVTTLITGIKLWASLNMFNLEKSKTSYPDVLRSYQQGKPPLENHNVGLHSGGLFCQ